MDDHKTARLDIHRKWTHPTNESLVGSISGTFANAFGPETKFSASIDFMLNGGITSEERFESVASWAEAIRPSWESTYVTATDKSGDRRLTLSANIKTASVSVWAEVHPEDRSLVLELYQQLEVGLQLRSTGDSDQAITSFDVRHYFKTKGNDPLDFIAGVKQLMQALDDPQNFHSSTEFAKPIGSGRDYRNIDSWASGTLETWQSLSAIDFSFSDSESTVYGRWEFAADHLQLRLSGTSEEGISKLFSRAEVELKIHSDNGAQNSRALLEGGERFFFVKGTVDKPWLEKASELLTSFYREDFYCHVRVRVLPKSRHSISNESPTAFRRIALLHWDNLLEANFSISGPGLNLNFNLDSPREKVVLAVNARTSDKVNEIFSLFIEKLELEETSGDEYSTPHSSGYYKISTWRNASFGQAVRDCVKQYIGTKFSLVRALVFELTEDGKETTERFETFDSFIARLSDEREYTATRVEVQGPRSNAMSIAALSKLTRLEIKSSLSDKEFNHVVNIFKDRIGLTKLGETKEEAEAKGSLFRDSAWVVVVVPLTISLIAAVASFFGGDPVRNYFMEKHSLRIVVPIKAANNTMTMKSPNVRVRWEVVRDYKGRRTVKSNEAANIQVVDESGNEYFNKRNALPGVELTFKPGMSRLTIVSEDPGVEDTAVISVVDPNSSPKKD